MLSGQNPLLAQDYESHMHMHQCIYPHMHKRTGTCKRTGTHTSEVNLSLSNMILSHFYHRFVEYMVSKRAIMVYNVEDDPSHKRKEKNSPDQ